MGDSTGGLSRISVEPEPPATLKTGEKLMVTATYKLPEGQSAKFAVRPYKEGLRARSYLAHPIVVCESGRGKAEGWFTFQRPATIDEVRVFLSDTGSTNLLAESILPADLRWE